MDIYLITNLVNGKKYVGQSVNPQKRWYEHTRLSKLESPSQHIHRAMKSHGIENFKFELIDECSTRDILNELEVKWISHYDTFKGHGYNMTEGGDSYDMSDEHKRNISKAHIGKKHTEEHKRNHSLSLKGKYVGGLNPNAKKITQLNKTTGEEIACWLSIMDICRELKLNKSCIVECCRGTQKTSGGFKWRYLDVSV